MNRPGGPEISVIIAVRDGERYLDEAIRSVYGQTHTDLELIVVDDGSTDSTATIAASYPAARLLRLPASGVSSARNAGLAAARGTVIAFLDADDVWHPHKLSVQLAVLRRHPEVDHVTCRIELFLQAGHKRPAALREELFRQPQPGLIPSALCVRRTACDRVGPFDPRLGSSEDTDWFLRAADAGLKHKALEDVLVRKRVHPGCASLRPPAGPSALTAVVGASLRRRRGA
ncbi:MAG: putative glycosyltransferase EpsE [Candidatus Omnitrophica bacterium]|nr:putative glycosyltransferase EpsE [Candidatus Omnitrophota bacterium]